MSEKMVKIKFLKNCMQWNEGMEVEFPESQATAMCQVRKRQTGYGLEDYRVAISLEEYEILKSLPVDQRNLSLKEAKELGLKNIASPPDADLTTPFFEEKKEEQPIKKSKK